MASLNFFDPLRRIDSNVREGPPLTKPMSAETREVAAVVAHHFIAFIAQIVALLFAVALWAAENDWSEGDASAAAGATRDDYNGAAHLPWDHSMGDWRDRDNVPQGANAFATFEVVDDDRGKFVRCDVTDLVRQWIAGEQQNQGFFLRVVSESGNIVFCSREHENKDWRPALEIPVGDHIESVEPTADTFLTKSTYRSQGLDSRLRVSSAPDNALLRFDLAKIGSTTKPRKITLRLYSTQQYATATIGVFRCQQGHDAPDTKPISGIAARYPGDQGIENDPDVLFASGFDDPMWADHWTNTGIMSVIDTVADDADRRFQPLLGKALRVRIAKGSNGALNTLWKYKQETGSEPSESFFRYYLRLGDDWNQTLQGGKLPGFSGTYGITGWGGRRSFGNQGWSARGLFNQTIPAGNPLAGKTPIGTYCYHADMTGNYGTNWLWQIGYRGYLENNRWYSIEQYLKLNTPGERNGILRAWVDGRPAFEKNRHPLSKTTTD